MRHVYKKIDAFVAGELNQVERDAVGAHLDECASCSALAREARELWDLLGEAADPLPAGSVRRSLWPRIQARTVGGRSQAGDQTGRRWLGVAVASAALAAGLGMAILLPGGQAGKVQMATTGDEAWGSSFWLDEQADTAFSELWLAAVDDGSGS